jgi:hypothetical protein
MVKIHSDSALEEDDDYVRFVKSLGLDDPLFAGLENDDEEFHLSDAEDEDEDDDDVAGLRDDACDDDAQAETMIAQESTPHLSSPLSSTPTPLPDFETDMYKDLEEELGSLLEEDLEAAVQSLMTSKKPTTPTKAATPSPKTPKASGKGKDTKPIADTINNTESPTTPLRDAARQGTRAQVSYQQAQQLRKLLTRHYQLLVQQAIMGVRAAQMQKLNKEKSDFLSGETADDLAEILDGAVGMLQDLDENRKDAIRNSIQLAESAPSANEEKPKSLSGRRSLLSKFSESSDPLQQQTKDRRLTRAAFSRSLQKGASGSKRTTFDIPGLFKLKETFATIDKCVDGVKSHNSILELPTHAEACRMVLREAGAHFEETLVPGEKEISDNFCDSREFFGDNFKAPCTEDQQIFLRKNRTLFTSGEDNLVLRGVNLYGEKQWILIADRYLPDRSVNIISQRYSKLCVMLYKANGIYIDAKGDLVPPPKHDSVDDINEAKVQELGLKAVDPPAILNVHRWSLDEDLTLLKAVPLMGHMWAELGARLIPHRDRGHLRKRYQVLERRVKATVARSSKGDTSIAKPSRWQSTQRKTTVPVVTLKPPLTKVGAKSTAIRLPITKKQAHRKAGIRSMTIEKAAASLAFLRPPRIGPLPTNLPHKTAIHSHGIPSRTAPCPPHHLPSSKFPPPPNPATMKHPYLSMTAMSKPPPPGGTKAPMKVVPLSKSLSHGSVRMSIQQRPVQKYPIAKSSTPSKLSWAEASLNNDPSFSRTAFEELVDGTGEEWSQMSRVKKMLENDAESQAADAIVSHLAKSPVPSNLSKLPQMDLDSDSMSGLSILQSEAFRQATNGESNGKTPSISGISIMSRVLGSTSKSSDTEKTPAHQKVSASSTSNELATERNIVASSAVNDINSPKKRPLKSLPSTPLPPSTPQRPNFFSTTGTPIGLSPGFRPSPSKQSGGTPFSPAPSMMQLVGNDQSVDEFRYCDFHISEESQRAFGGGKSQHNQDQNPPPLTPSKNSFLAEQLMQNDLEAISALNSLSNSPFKPKRQPSNGESKSKADSKKSLFATVVGGVQDTKQKLEF